MENIKTALERLEQGRGPDRSTPLSFEEFLKALNARPLTVIRNVFQVFNEMVKTHISEGIDEYPDDPESINYVYYDCSRLFVEGSDHPFFADRLFANRLVNLVEALKRGAQQNKIYIFAGPHGCGKSTFLNNLLRKLEEYANTEEGSRYEALWRLDRKLLGDVVDHETSHLLEKVLHTVESTGGPDVSELQLDQYSSHLTDEYVEVPCPSHDHPLLMIPKDLRRSFLDALIEDPFVKETIFTQKEFEWVFKDIPCTICSSLYQALLRKLKSPVRVLAMVYARPFHFNKRLGQGISVFNPGDRPIRQTILTNPAVQRRIDHLLRDSTQVKYIFSRYAKSNNGVYALMDIKSHNTERLIELHNIISEGVHKVEDVEENVSSLFFALMNPEDRKNIDEYQSFLDRIEYIKIPYVLDVATEVEIYRNVFGRHIDASFLPGVLRNFARVILSSRLLAKSEALLEWIGNPQKYRLYCDENLMLLKMEIYTGVIPPWLSEEDRKRFTAKRRRKIIADSEVEGEHGFSGRDSIKIFNDFYSAYAKGDKLINMSVLCNFFTKSNKELSRLIPEGFLHSLVRMYNYSILQEVKESLYYYNEEQIARDVKNYLFAINFEIGSVEKCRFTGETLEISEDFLQNIENRILGGSVDIYRRLGFRRETQKEYTEALTQEIMVERKEISETKLFHALHERYAYNLKEKVLDPFLENENFRRAIKDYEQEEFKTYDKKIRDDVTFLINNLCTKHGYTRQGAKEVCIYVIDNDLAKQFGAS